MSILDYFTRTKSSTASIAKERLQIIVAHERKRRDQPEYLAALQRDIMEVVTTYVDIDTDSIEVQLEKNGDCSVLELNVTLPETLPEKASA